MKILSFGEILWDVYPNEKHLGGAPLNFAAHLAKHGDEVFMWSALGNDELGKRAAEIIEKWNISTEFINILPQFETGKCVVSLDEFGIPKYNLLENTAYDNIPDVKTGDFDVLYFGSLALRSKTNFENLKRFINSQSFKEIFVDVNVRPPFYSAENLCFAVSNATILKISLEELPIVAELTETENNCEFEEFAKALSLSYKNLKLVIITLGEEGAFVLDCRTGKSFYSKAQKVKAVSTVGAGDSFSAAFLHKYLKGESLDECLLHATKIAAFVVTSSEAVPDYDPDEI